MEESEGKWGGVFEGFSIILGDGFLIFVGWRRGLLEREREREKKEEEGVFDLGS